MSWMLLQHNVHNYYIYKHRWLDQTQDVCSLSLYLPACPWNSNTCGKSTILYVSPEKTLQVTLCLVCLSCLSRKCPIYRKWKNYKVKNLSEDCHGTGNSWTSTPTWSNCQGQMVTISLNVFCKVVDTKSLASLCHYKGRRWNKVNQTWQNTSNEQLRSLYCYRFSGTGKQSVWCVCVLPNSNVWTEWLLTLTSGMPVHL